jgi:hypothetical protein
MTEEKNEMIEKPFVSADAHVVEPADLHRVAGAG